MLHSNRYVLAALVGLAAIFSSCSVKEDLAVCEKSEAKSEVYLDLRGFGLEQSSLTKASETQAPHRIVFKAFDSSGKAVYDSTQVSSQEGFGSLSFELSPGAYTFVAVAHDVALTGSPAAPNPDRSVAASIVSPSQATVPEPLIQDTFCDTLNVTIEPGVPFAAGMTLPRIISSFEIYLNDMTPTGTKMFKIVANTAGSEASGNASFNPSTGLASTDRQYVKEEDISAGIGIARNHIGLNLFLNADEEDIDITATAYNVDGQVIASHTLKDVPMKRNCLTVARGNFFTTGGSGTFSFLTDWGTERSFEY